MRIVVLDAKARRLVNQGGAIVRGEMVDMMSAAGRTLRDLVRQNIQTEGQTFGDPWKPVSKWIVAKKAARKPLAGMHRYVFMRKPTGSVVEIGFRSPGKWSIDQHHRGFTVQPTGARVDLLNLKRPSALGISRKTFSFVSYRASVVPRRRIWPRQSQVPALISADVRRFTRRLARRLSQ